MSSTSGNDWHVLPVFSPLFHSKKPYYILTGGRGSGKTSQVAAYFLMKLLDNEQFFRGVITRYTQSSVKSSIYQGVLDLIKEWRVEAYIYFKGEEIHCKTNDNMVITHAMRLSENTMSAKGKGLSKVTHLLIDEAQELPSEEEYIKLNDTFRYAGAERKIFVALNPTSKRHWIFNRWFLADGTPNPKWKIDHIFIHSTYKDNTSGALDPVKIAEWERSATEDPEYYRHHILGEWTDGVKGKIFEGWEIGECTDDIDTVYGLDFGFSTDPTSLVRVKRHNKVLFLHELIYSTNLTNQDIYQRMVHAGVPTNALIIADSAEPKSIEELRRLGYNNVRPAYKGPDSINMGINRIKSHTVLASPSSKNLWSEYDQYAWKEGTDKPIDKYNHCMDAVRYALSLDSNRKGVELGSSEMIRRRTQVESERELYS